MGKYLKSVGKNSLDFLKYVGPGLLVTVGFIDPGKLGIQYSCRFRLWIQSSVDGDIVYGYADYSAA